MEHGTISTHASQLEQLVLDALQDMQNWVTAPSTCGFAAVSGAAFSTSLAPVRLPSPSRIRWSCGSSPVAASPPTISPPR